MAFPVKPEAAFASCFRNIFQDMHPIFNSRDLLSFWGIDRELKTLQKRLKGIQDVLNDAEWRSQTEGRVSDWMDDLRELLYCIEDFVDDMNIERVRMQKQLADKNHHLPDHQSPYIIMDIMEDYTSQKNTICESIKVITGKLDKVEKDAEKRKLQPQTLAGTPLACFGAVRDGDDIGPLVDESEVYGRQEDKDHVIELLMSPNDSSKNCSVVSIVGMGGVGKTTLARFVFQDKRVENYFDMQSWACVSYDFDFNRVVRELIEYAADKENTSVTTTPALLACLKRMVAKKKVLVVLDDMWTVEAWEKLRAAFADCAKGSKILVTTRDKIIGNAINNKEIYELQILEDEHCWVLFKEKAFGGVVDERNWKDVKELENIGREIVERCKGVPLAVKVIGSSLLSAPKEMWESTLKNEIWQSKDVAKDEIFPVLKLSYHYLPSSLKRCFQYFSVFPTDHWFQRDDLVRLWIAEGLIEYREGRTLEDIGCTYYIELQRRCLIQENNTMHDLLHGLACLVSGKFFSRSAKGSKSYTHLGSIPHLSLIDKEVNIEIFDEATCFRTLLVSKDHLFDEINLKWTLLRVLDLRNNHLSELPSSVRNLRHLRYLNLSSCRNLQNLPDSICELYNLQTLDLSYCCGTTALPTEMGNLQNLRYLCLREMKYLSALPSSIVKLSNLLTLNLNGCRSLTCMPDKIGDLKSLQTLDLSCCCGTTALPTEMGNLQNLRYLFLWGMEYLSALPSSIVKLSNLLTLNLKGCRSLTCMPDKIGDLKSLQILDLNDCHLLSHLPNEIGGCQDRGGGRQDRGGLQDLRELRLGGTSISCLPESICKIRNLRVLDISNCAKLNSLPHNIGKLTCIEKLGRFVVGRAEGHGIEELKNMNKLQGVLTISYLENVGSVKHALMANLKKKVLDEIYFEWSSASLPNEGHNSINGLEDDDISDVVDIDLEARVLDALEPYPTSLEALYFLNYRGGRIPKWMSALTFPILKDLVMIGLEGINRMVDVELPSLERLKIKNCLKLKDVSMRVPNLIHLEVSTCRDLTTLSMSPSLGNSSSSLASSRLDLPRLKEVMFSDCSSLRDIHMMMVPQLEALLIEDCKKLKIYADHKLNLHRLMLKSLADLTLLGGHHPGSLPSGCEHELKFNGCSILRDICTVAIPGLNELWIEDCKELKMILAVPDCMPKLWRLTLNSLPNLTLLGGRQPKSLFLLTSLEELRICPGCEHELRISMAMPFDCEARESDDLLLPEEEHWSESSERISMAMPFDCEARESDDLLLPEEEHWSESSDDEHERISMAMPFDCEARESDDLLLPEEEHGSSDDESSGDGSGMFPNLGDLYVQKCPELQFSHLTSLKSITFSCDQLEAEKEASLQNLSRLEDMVIRGFAGQVLPLAGDDEAGSTSTSLPPNLTKLAIQNCPNLTSLPKALHTFASLRTMIISDCPKLVSFPQTGLPPLLEHLIIYSCMNLQYLPTGLGGHTSLQDVFIGNCDQVQARPDDGPPPNIYRLTVSNCPKLEQQIKQHRRDWLAKTHFPEAWLPASVLMVRDPRSLLHHHEKSMCTIQ